MARSGGFGAKLCAAIPGFPQFGVGGADQLASCHFCKLLAGFLVTCLLMIGIGAVGIFKLRAAQASLEGMYRDSTRATNWLGTVDTAFNLVRGQYVNYVITPDRRERPPSRRRSPTPG